MMPKTKTIALSALLSMLLLATSTNCAPPTCAFDADMDGEFSIEEGLAAIDQLSIDLNLQIDSVDDLETIDDQIFAAIAANPFILLQYSPCLDILNDQFSPPAQPPTQP